MDVVEISDGWQARRARAFGGLERDWLAAFAPAAEGDDSAVPARAVVERAADGPLARVVTEIERRGWSSAVWVMPLGQSDDDLFESRPETFLRDADGDAVYGRTLGNYVVDPTSAAGREYLRELFEGLRASGCRAFRLAGLGEAARIYREHRKRLAKSGAEAMDVLRTAIETAREGGGGDVQLSGDWDTPLELIGCLDRVRCDDPEWAALSPLARELRALRRSYSGHGHGWETESTVLSMDPAGLAASTPARASVKTLATLTGRGAAASGMLAGFALPDTNHPDVLVRALDIRGEEADAALTSNRSLLVAAPTRAGAHSVVAAFNDSELLPVSKTIRPDAVGVAATRAQREAGAELWWFDVRAERVHGRGWDARDVVLMPSSSRLLTLTVANGLPEVLGVSAHAYGSAASCDGIQVDEQQRLWSARLNVVPKRRERRAVTAELTSLALARNRIHLICPHDWRPTVAEADGARAGFRVRGRHLIVEVQDAEKTPVEVRVRFEAREAPVVAEELDVDQTDAIAGGEPLVTIDEALRAPVIEWWEAGHAAWAGASRAYELLRDGDVIATTWDTRYVDRDLSWGGSASYSVRVVESDRSTIPVRVEWPQLQDADLSLWSPIDEPSSAAVRGRSVQGGVVTIGGESAESAWGMTAPASLSFQLAGNYRELRAKIGVDDASGPLGDAVFVVGGDGRELFRSRAITGGARGPVEIRVDVTDVDVLTLAVEGDGAVGWCEPVLTADAAPADDSQTPAGR